MAFRRYSRSRSASNRSFGRRRSTRTRRRRSMRGRSAQTVRIVVVGGGAGGMVPISSTVAKKGARPVRRRF